jgi:hypothetical protein
MRHILLAMVVGLGLAACAQPAIQPVIKSDQFSCRSPQVAGLSEQLSNRLCLQNDILAELDVEGPEATRPALETAAHILLNHQRIEPSAARADPKGTRCLLLLPIFSSLSRMPEGQTYCALNSYWASHAPMQPHWGPPAHCCSNDRWRDWRDAARSSRKLIAWPWRC